MIDFRTFRTISYEEAIAKRIRRQLSTAKGAYSIYVRYEDGIYKQEEKMGSLIPRLLSMPKTQAVLDRIKESAIAVLQEDDFINLIAVNIKSNRNQEVNLEIRYSIKALNNQTTSLEIAI